MIAGEFLAAGLAGVVIISLCLVWFLVGRAYERLQDRRREK